MPATLEAPPRKTPTNRRRTPGTWTKEQAQAANAKSHITRRIRAQQRKEAKLQTAPDPKPECVPDPITHVSKAIERAAKRNCGQLAANLALALSRLKNAPKPSPSASNTPTSCSPVRQPTPAIPQSAQVVEPKYVQPVANFAQYTEPLVQGSKESLNCGIVVAGGGGGAAVGVGVGGVIEPITHRPFSTANPSNTGKTLQEATMEELEARLVELRGKSSVKPAPTVYKPSSVGVVPSGNVGSVGVKAQVGGEAGLEKFLVGGVWVWGRRKK